VAPNSTNNLAAAQPNETTRELDLSLLLQASRAEQKRGWERLSQLVRQALDYRCNQITIEPEQHCWRTRFFAIDKNVEHIDYDTTELQQLADNFSTELNPTADDSGPLHSVLIRVKQQRYLILINQLPGVDGATYSLTLEPWQPMPSSLNDLQLPSEIDRRIRHWLSDKGGWLTVAGPSSSLNVHSQLALLQSITGPEVRVLHAAHEQRYSFARVSQIALRDIQEQHRDVVWQQALASNFDYLVLDGVPDKWLQSLANMSAPDATVIHTVNALNASTTLGRLQSLKLDQTRFARGRTAILTQYPIRLQCEHCKCPDNNTQAHNDWLKSWLEPNDSIEAWTNTQYKGFMSAPGCQDCHQTGLSDWTTIYEWLEFNPEIKTAINNGSWQSAISLLQLQQSVVQDVFKLARQGLISLTEAKRVLSTVSY